MIGSVIQWFQSKPFVQQLIILAVVCDPIGFVGGYLLAPSVGVDPLIGGVFGVAAAGFPVSLHVLTHAMNAE